MTSVLKADDEPLINAADVENYLARHPEFFVDHEHLLEILEVPHASGEAVSLVSRQIDVLREKNRRLQSQIGDIVQIARDNDTLFQRIHRLTLALLGVVSLEDGLAALRWSLHECFQSDFVAIRLVEPVADFAIADVFVARDDRRREDILYFLDRGRPVCGKPAEEQALALFGADGAEVASYALVPLEHAGLRGVLAIGSRNADRFEAGMGLTFLKQMGEIVAGRFAALVAGLQ